MRINRISRATGCLIRKVLRRSPSFRPVLRQIDESLVKNHATPTYTLSVEIQQLHQPSADHMVGAVLRVAITERDHEDDFAPARGLSPQSLTPFHRDKCRCS